MIAPSSTASQRDTPARERTLLHAALDYAARGWPVVPLFWPLSAGADARCACGRAACKSVGKHPHNDLALHGLNSATTDVQRIATWWRRFPEANIGIVLGKVAGMFAIDTDPKHGGDQNLAELVNEHGPLGPTLRATSGSGGQHYFFRWLGRSVNNSVGRLARGVDVRGDGGYVVAAPSLHANGALYRWENPGAAVLDAPPWLLTKMLDVSNQSPQAAAPPRRASAAPRRALPFVTQHQMLETMVNECAFIRHAIEDATTLSYEEWFGLATVLHPFPAGDQLFDEISREDPARYQEREARKKAATIRGGPRHCTNLGWSCPKLATCSRLGVRSPAGLPYKLLTLRKGLAA